MQDLLVCISIRPVNNYTLTTAIPVIHPSYPSLLGVGLVEAIGSLASLFTALPVGWMADKLGKSRVCFAGGLMMMVGAAATIILVLNPWNWDNDKLFMAFIITQGLWGISSGITSGPAQALFADSLEQGSRSNAYMYLQLCYMIPSLVGPIIAIVMFSQVGDDWTHEQMRPIFIVGLALEFPAAMTLFFLSDDLAVKEEDSDAEEDREEVDDLLKKPDVSASAVVKPDTGSTLEPDASPRSPKDVESNNTSPRRASTKKKFSIRIPLTMFLGDLLIAIGAGMTVKFGPLFFKQDVQLGPIAVQGVYIAQMSMIGMFTVTFTKIGSRIGRIQAAFVARVLGLSALTSMSVLCNNNIKNWYYICPLFAVRSGLMNATYPLDESIVMDYVPSSQRARWKSLESIGSFGWAGSAVLGGWLADKYDYTTTFLITAALQGTGALLHLTLINLVPRENAEKEEKEKAKKAKETESNNLNKPLLSADSLGEPLLSAA
jgi:MFS family permease